MHCAESHSDLGADRDKGLGLTIFSVSPAEVAE